MLPAGSDYKNIIIDLMMGVVDQINIERQTRVQQIHEIKQGTKCPFVKCLVYKVRVMLWSLPSSVGHKRYHSWPFLSPKS